MILKWQHIIFKKKTVKIFFNWETILNANLYIFIFIYSLTFVNYKIIDFNDTHTDFNDTHTYLAIYAF